METARNTRESSTRKKTWRPAAKLETPTPPPGYKYRWVRHEIKGEDQTLNVYNRNREGYEPVRRDEISQEAFLDVMDEGRHEGVVRSGDLILMKVPVEIAQQRQDYYESQAKRMQQAVDQELDGQSSSDMPIHRENSSSVSKGGSGPTRFED